MRVVYIRKVSQPVKLTVIMEVMNKFPTINPNNVETLKHPGTGIQYPYDKERDFLSRFPVGFNGCYNCG